MCATWFDGTVYTVWFDGVCLELRPAEYQVFRCLFMCRGTLVTRTYLQQVLRTGSPALRLRSVDVLVSRFRRKYMRQHEGDIVDCVKDEGYVLRNV
jgi:DNA-binding response OmpR family regulator